MTVLPGAARGRCEEVVMAGTPEPPQVREVREAVREFALALPEAYEEFPWGESVAKVNKKVFVFLGSDEGGHRPGFTVKLKDTEVHEHALTVPGAEPAGYGLGRAGWVSVPFGDGAPPVEVLCEWVEDSYRAVAPKRLLARLDEARDGMEGGGPRG
jgi:predicted DNA-binding protein (MmcQ/YjbR family)